MRFLSLLLVLAGFVLAFAGLGHSAGVCADGTAYGACSTRNPGQYCIGNLDSPALGTLITICPCSRFPGYIQEGEGDTANCVLAKCDDGTNAGNCAIVKPKVCVGGSLYADNATKCGCPAGKRAAADGIFCGFIPCNDAGVSVPEGTCSPKKGTKCVSGVLVDKASECGCPAGKTKMGDACSVVCSDGTEDGKCSSTKPKKCTNGYLLDDAVSCGCPEGLNPVGKQCSASVLGGLGGADALSGGNASNETGTAGGANALSCCCLPTALVGIAGGFIFFRKRN
jgi:hypothetical protein